MGIITDIKRIKSYKNAPRRYSGDDSYDELTKLCWVYNFKGEKHDKIPYTSFNVTEKIILDAIQPPIDYIKARYDCSDFRALWLMKLLFDGGQDLFQRSPQNKIQKLLKECLTTFKYWISDDGDDSMCYHSENHQASFAVLEYLCGQYYAEITFADNLTGKEHMARAKERLEIWRKQRLKYGYNEFLSHNYLPINIGVISLLLRYAKDNAIKELMKKPLNILFYDMALQNYKGTFIGAQGRAYPRNNMNCAFKECNTDHIIDYAFQLGKYDYKAFIGEQCWFFTTMMMARDEKSQPYYTIPQEILEVALYSEECEIKMSSGLTFAEMKNNGLIGQDMNALMFQLGMGALSNPEIVENTLTMVNRFDLFTNDFVSSLKYFDLNFIKKLKLAPKLSKAFNLFPNGMALERHNIYTYKTRDYKLCTLQKYKPQSSGAQQTTMALTLNEGVTVYTHHPLREDKIEGAPSYWAGYGVAPDAVQNKGVAILIHKIPRNIFLAPTKMPRFTHTYFPTELLDEVVLSGNYIFGRKNNAVFALIGNSKFTFMPYDTRITELSEGLLKDSNMPFDLVQKGAKQFTIYEVSTLEKEVSFENFIARIKGNYIQFQRQIVTYHSNNNKYKSKFRGEFFINDTKVDTQYKRYESIFGVTEREDSSLYFKE